MIVATCPLRVSLFGGSTDHPHFVEKYGRGTVISFTSSLKTYVTISQDQFGYNKQKHKYIINYSRREEVSEIQDIQNEVVRTVLKHYQMPPCQVTLTSDAYSQGSGLASSSSYTLSLIKACSIFLGLEITESEACKLAFELERTYNPYCGYQDPYGCGVGGFKRITFLSGDSIKYDFLSTDIFEFYDMHLVFTGVTRNSKSILQEVAQNIEKVKPLLETADKAYDLLIKNNYESFLKLINIGWERKKKTSSNITKNKTVRSMDAVLASNDTVLAHRLCGAGNGGFFLTFSKPHSLTIPYQYIKIYNQPYGVYGKSI